MKPANLCGLTSAEVAQRVAMGQVNRVQRSELAEYRDIVVRNVLTLFNAMVIPAAVTLFALGELKGALAVTGFALTNTLIGLVQEVRAKWHLEHLALLAESRARVLRAGQEVEVRSSEVVQDDVLLLAAGDSVLADGTILDAHFLEVDEALLTGESDPVPRRPGDPVLSGSFCVAGEGAYRADRVGAEAFAQKTSSEARSYRFTASPMQQSINRLIQVLSAAAVGLCGLYLALFFVGGELTEVELARRVAATITLMVPQGLVLMATLAFILGAVRMSRRGAVVQRLNAVESMASINTLCLDKTGTLTTNQLKLQHIVTLAGQVPEEEVRERLRWFVGAAADRASKSLTAIRAAVGTVEVEVLDYLPFKSQNRCSAVRVRRERSQTALALGAVEALRELLAAEHRGAVERAWSQWLPSGLRLLLFAEMDDTHPNAARPFQGSLEGFVLRPLALLALSDELRPEAGGVLRLLAGQGIDFKIISGDNPDTVRATVGPLAEGAEEPALRALTGLPVVTGAELESAREEAGELIQARTVFGRVAPWQKVQIVTALKENHRQVAMIGDGVNDVLPLKTAHLGIAMGEGSRASKTVSGLVLESNNFGLLPQTLDEGRTIIRNLRRSAKLFLSNNVFTPILVLGAIVCGLPFPFLPQHVTLFDVLTIGLPVLLVTLEHEKSAAAARGSFLGEVGWFVLRTGIIIGGSGLLLMFLAGRIFGPDVGLQQTLALTLVTGLGLVTLLRLLREGESRKLAGDRWFYWLIGLDILVFLGVMYFPRLTFNFFEVRSLGLEHWGLVAVVGVPAMGLLYLSDWWAA